VLNPKIQKQAIQQGDKKKRHITDAHKHHVCFFSRASGRFATQEGTKAFIVVSGGFGRLLRRGCPVDAGILLLSCLLFAFRDCLSSSSSSSSVVVCVRDREKLYPF
jgi:hypothetical protein